MSLIYNFLRKPPNKNALFLKNYFIDYQIIRKKLKENLLIYNKLTEIFADFRHFCRAVILLTFSYLRYKNSINAARWRHDGGGGLEIIVNKKLSNDGGTRRRPRCKYQAVHIQLSFVPLRRFSRWKTASSPPPSTAEKAVFIQHSSILKTACFGRKTASLGGF